MGNFIRTSDRLVNLKNVSNINILHGECNRVIFNMNYNIEMGKKQISDYVYWDATDLKELERNIQYLKLNTYFCDNFIYQIDGKGFININEISSVKLAPKKNRVIFNLSHPVSFRDFSGNEKLTSEFVYVNCNTLDKYKQYVEYVQQRLGEYNGSQNI